MFMILMLEDLNKKSIHFSIDKKNIILLIQPIENYLKSSCMLCAMKENLKVDNSRLGASFLNRLYHTESHFISLIIPLKMLRKGTKRLCQLACLL